MGWSDSRTGLLHLSDLVHLPCSAHTLSYPFPPPDSMPSCPFIYLSHHPPRTTCFSSSSHHHLSIAHMPDNRTFQLCLDTHHFAESIHPWIHTFRYVDILSITCSLTYLGTNASQILISKPFKPEQCYEPIHYRLYTPLSYFSQLSHRQHTTTLTSMTITAVLPWNHHLYFPDVNPFAYIHSFHLNTFSFNSLVLSRLPMPNHPHTGSPCQSLHGLACQCFHNRHT